MSITSFIIRFARYQQTFTLRCSRSFSHHGWATSLIGMWRLMIENDCQHYSKTVDSHAYVSYKFHNSIRTIHCLTDSPCIAAAASAITIVLGDFSDRNVTFDCWKWPLPWGGSCAKQSTVAKLAVMSFDGAWQSHLQGHLDIVIRGRICRCPDWGNDHYEHAVALKGGGPVVLPYTVSQAMVTAH